MQDIIRLLPDSLANQIAAGEVVQRPASVVKELLENAIDAKSTKITVVVQDAGKTLIQVVDNGSGMSETDARLCFERHATSKIRETQDLFQIRTMGFRGEALASIAAVAKVELKTKRENDDLGTHICIEGSQFKFQEEVASSTGTVMTVKSLFFNVPARRNFLKSNPVEMRHILDEFHRVALANPKIEFSLFNNDLEIYHLPAGKLSQRIVGIFGKNYQKQIVPCAEESPFLKISGYIGKPQNAKKTRGEQFFFVNHRFVKHGYLHHAIVQAFEDLIAKEAHPFYVLFLEIDPKHIDINVHPKKTEIKFDDERTVYSIIHAAVKKALSVHHLTPSLDFDTNANFQTFSQQDFSPNFPKTTTPREKNNLVNWQNLYEGLEKRAITDEHFQLGIEETKLEQEPTVIQSRANQLSQENSTEKLPKERPVFQIQQEFLVAPMASGLLLINQQAAHERILYDRFQKHQENKNPPSQQLLFPVELSLNPADFQLFSDIQSELQALGFLFEVLENQQIRFTGVPAVPMKGSEQEWLEKLLEQFKNHQDALKVNKRDTVLKMFVKRASLKQGTILNPTEMNLLIDQLFASSNPNFAPDGATILVQLGAEELRNWFH